MKMYEPLKPAVPTDLLKLIALAMAAAAAAATLAALMSKLSQSRFQRKMMNCADSVQSALPTLRRAAELYIQEHDPSTNEDDLPF